MTSLKDWPRWAQALFATTLLFIFLGLCVAAEYRARTPERTDRTALAQQFEQSPRAWLAQPKDVSELERQLAARQVAAVGVDANGTALVTTRQGARYSTRLLSADNGLGARLEALSREHGFALTRIELDPESPQDKLTASIAAVLGRMGPIVVLVILGAVALNLAQRSGRLSGNGPELSEKPDTQFDHVIGATEAKAALQQVTAFMRNPEKYLSLGAKPPRGVLLEGPPGTGKTMLARALAGECGANFIAVDGSHFSSMFYGAGISKVKELFATARKNAPCIIFIDEFDGIGKRSSGQRSAQGSSEENRIINKLLVEMDGFKASENVIVIGATNHVTNVDEALRRPGRFDLVAKVTLPHLPDRRALFERCLTGIKHDGKIDLDVLARSSTGLSHAEITHVINRSAVLAAEDDAEVVTAQHIHRALETLQLGGDVSPLKPMITEEDRRRIAVHESGHAIVAHGLGAGTVERVTIEPRGQALGVTFMTRHNEVPLYGEAELKGRLGMLLAGREAELMAFGNTTSGASDDLKRASELAIEMVSAMGFSAEFGLLSVQGVPQALIGPHLQERVLKEAKALLDEAQYLCRDMLMQRRGALETLTAALLKQETVSGDLLKDLLNSPDTVEDQPVALHRRIGAHHHRPFADSNFADSTFEAA